MVHENNETVQAGACPITSRLSPTGLDSVDKTREAVLTPVHLHDIDHKHTMRTNLQWHTSMDLSDDKRDTWSSALCGYIKPLCVFRRRSICFPIRPRTADSTSPPDFLRATRSLDHISNHRLTSLTRPKTVTAAPPRNLSEISRPVPSASSSRPPLDATCRVPEPPHSDLDPPSSKSSKRLLTAISKRLSTSGSAQQLMRNKRKRGDSTLVEQSRDRYQSRQISMATSPGMYSLLVSSDPQQHTIEANLLQGGHINAHALVDGLNKAGLTFSELIAGFGGAAANIVIIITEDNESVLKEEATSPGPISQCKKHLSPSDQRVRRFASRRIPFKRNPSYIGP